MARPKRMGAYNALDDLLPGGVWGNPRGSPSGSGPTWDPGPVGDEPSAWDQLPAGLDDEPGPRWRRPRLEPVPDPLDDLLPGPSVPERRRVALAPRPRSAGRHLGVWNPLDGPPTAPVPAQPDPVPAKVRVGFRLNAEVVETARDAVAHLAATPDRTTLTALVERALRVELARLAITHNDGRPFPPRET